MAAVDISMNSFQQPKKPETVWWPVPKPVNHVLGLQLNPSCSAEIPVPVDEIWQQNQKKKKPPIEWRKCAKSCSNEFSNEAENKQEFQQQKSRIYPVNFDLHVSRGWANREKKKKNATPLEFPPTGSGWLPGLVPRGQRLHKKTWPSAADGTRHSRCEPYGLPLSRGACWFRPKSLDENLAVTGLVYFFRFHCWLCDGKTSNRRWFFLFEFWQAARVGMTESDFRGKLTNLIQVCLYVILMNVSNYGLKKQKNPMQNIIL